MQEKLEAAIEVLKERLAEQERKIGDTKRLINELCQEAGIAPLYPDADHGSQSVGGSITGDTFYGDPSVTTAARRFLEMRKAARQGPASTREIYDALKAGNFQFETEDANNAMTNIRATMRKNSSIFHRLPDNRWGLRGWYDRIKGSGEADKAERRSAKKRGRPRKARPGTSASAQPQRPANRKAKPAPPKSAAPEMKAEPESASPEDKKAA